MAINGSGDSADSVRIYTTDTIVDHPGAEIVYKGFITFNAHEAWTRSLTNMTVEAKERASRLDANAIVGVKIVDGNGRYTFTGTAVRFFPK